MISLNGDICLPESFHWLKDSGFRYGYGCFETMHFSNHQITLFDLHMSRLKQSLEGMGINASIDGLKDRVLALANALKISTPQACHVFITGGDISPSPKLSAKATEIISFSPLPTNTFSKRCCFLTVETSDYYKFKSLSYTHHIQALNTSNDWPIYVDTKNTIVDSAIFSIGMIVNDTIIFAEHKHQLPSVSKAGINQLLNCHSQPLTKDMLENANVIFGCNALRGAFPISITNPNPPTHTKIDEMNQALGLDGCNFS